MKLTRILFALIVTMFSFTAFAASYIDKLPAGTHVASLTDAGKPGVALRKIDTVAAERLLSSGRIATNQEPPRVAPVFNGAVIKLKNDRVVAFIGDLHKFSAVIPVLVYPDGEESVLGAVGVEEEGSWFIPLVFGEMHPMFTLRGFPTLRLQVFDPSIGLFELSSSLDFHQSEPEGINEIRVVGEPVVKILGQFDNMARVVINFEPVPEESIRRKEDGIGVGKYDPETGESLLYTGDNYFTVVTGDGACYTRTYTYNPSYEER